MPLANVISSYAEYYASGDSHTARAKRNDLKLFLEFLTSQNSSKKQSQLLVRDWNHSAVQQFLEHCLKQSQAPATVRRRLATLKHMGRTLAEKVPGFVNPAREVKSPKLATLKPKALSPDEIASIYEKINRYVADKPSFVRSRNRLLFIMLLETGLRAEEIRTLKLAQFDAKFEWLKDVRTKGRRFRNVYINSSFRAMLLDYLEHRNLELRRIIGERHLQKHHSQLPLFVSSYGANLEDPASFAMGAKSVWRAIKTFSTATKLHPHLLRHSFAVDLLNSSNDIRLVAQALGHSDVRVTMRYTERDDEQVALAMEHSKASKVKAHRK